LVVVIALLSLTAEARRLGDKECEQQCQDPKFKDLEYFDKEEKILDPSVLLKRLQKERKKWTEGTLYKNYGQENFQNIFQPELEVWDLEKNDTVTKRVSVGKHVIFKDVTHLATDSQGLYEKHQQELTGKPPVAWARLIRKWQIKVMQLRLSILEERLNAKAICLDECTRSANGEEDKGRQRKLGVQASGGKYTKVTWTTGGHSSSAGHGNLFTESYTARLGEALTPLLKNALGFDFVAKNYAMGGTASADQVALCYNSIFGRDMDFFSWDYGMTDGTYCILLLVLALGWFSWFIQRDFVLQCIIIFLCFLYGQDTTFGKCPCTPTRAQDYLVTENDPILAMCPIVPPCLTLMLVRGTN